MTTLLHGKPAVALTVLLLVQAIVFYRGIPSERIPSRQRLADFPHSLEAWELSGDYPLDTETLQVLRADDTVNRMYRKQAGGMEVNLFIAYFASQRNGQTPHSPKNCLPGSGFEPVASGPLDVAVPARAKPITVNRYLVTRGDERKLVLYWYQSRDRVVASEYLAKIRLVLDSIRYHRSDTALVRVTVPAVNGQDAISTQVGAEFIRCVFPRLSAFLPS